MCKRLYLLGGILLVLGSNCLAQDKKGGGVAATSDRMQSLAYAPDGKWIIGGAYDGTVRVWNVETGKPERDLQSPKPIWVNTYTFVTVSPSGDMVAVGGSEGAVRLWETKTWKMTATLGGHMRTGAVPRSFSPDGKTLAVGSHEYLGPYTEQNSEIKLWDVQKGECKRTIPLPKKRETSMVFSPDAATLYVASDLILLIDVATGETKRTLKPDSGTVHRLCLSPDGKTLYAGGGYSRPLGGGGTEFMSEVYVFDLASGKQLRTMKDLQQHLNGLALSKDGKLLATGTQGPLQTRRDLIAHSSVVSVWEAATGKLVFTEESWWGSVGPLVFAPDAKTLLCSNDSRVWFLDVPSGKERSVLHKTTTRFQQ